MEVVEEINPSSCDKKFSLWVVLFWSYTLWKIGFVASPETSLKHVFRVKMT
jgi:hypothetical protein